MARNRHTSNKPRAGGALIALATLLGAVVGIVLGQPSIGLLAGFGVGSIAAVAIWYSETRRR